MFSRYGGLVEEDLRVGDLYMRAVCGDRSLSPRGQYTSWLLLVVAVRGLAQLRAPKGLRQSEEKGEDKQEQPKKTKRASGVILAAQNHTKIMACP